MKRAISRQAWWKRAAVVLCSLALAGLAAGCRSTPRKEAGLVKLYRESLKATESAGAAAVELAPGSDAERAAIDRFVDFYREYSTDVIRKGVRDVYAADAYFGDPFHGVKGLDAIEKYFLAMAEPVERCTFDVEDWNHEGSEYYFRWTMHLVIKRAPDDPIEALGFSHVRYNADGLVIFQQDYWDTSVLFERLPLVGPLTRWIKRRLH